MKCNSCQFASNRKYIMSPERIPDAGIIPRCINEKSPKCGQFLYWFDTCSHHIYGDELPIIISQQVSPEEKCFLNGIFKTSIK